MLESKLYDAFGTVYMDVERVDLLRLQRASDGDIFVIEDDVEGRCRVSFSMWEADSRGTPSELMTDRTLHTELFDWVKIGLTAPPVSVWTVVTSGIEADGHPVVFTREVWNRLAKIGSAYGHNVELFGYGAVSEDGFFSIDVYRLGLLVANVSVHDSMWRGSTQEFLRGVLEFLVREAEGDPVLIKITSSPADGQGGFSFDASMVMMISKMDCEVHVVVPVGRGSETPDG